MAGSSSPRNGAVKVFIREKLGQQKLNDLYNELGSFSMIADYVFNNYGFFCSGYALKRLFVLSGGVLNKHGGDRKSVDFLKKFS